ncbi:hypothetical protein D3C87_1674780 [compost metagenome]
MTIAASETSTSASGAVEDWAKAGVPERTGAIVGTCSKSETAATANALDVKMRILITPERHRILTD